MNQQKIVQVCVVARDLDKAMENYSRLLNIGPWDVHRLNNDVLKEYTYRGRVVTEPYEFFVAVTDFGNIQFEIAVPVRGPSIYTEFLEKKGEGYHHIKEYVPDDQMRTALDGYKQKGVDVIQSGHYDEDRFYYLDTEPILGVTVELGNCGKVRSPYRQYPALIKDKSKRKIAEFASSKRCLSPEEAVHGIKSGEISI